MTLEKYMKLTNIGYKELAAKAGVHYTTIFKYLQSETRCFRYPIAEKVSKATDGKVSILTLVGAKSE